MHRQEIIMYYRLDELRPLAEKGDPGAQNNLAKMYNDGDRVPQSYKTAVYQFLLDFIPV